MISAIVPYCNNAHGLTATLIMLQQQTLLPGQIIIIDSSENQIGKALALRYRLPNVRITVQIHNGNIYQAWNKGIELAGQTDCLILNDDLLFPLDMVELFADVKSKVPALAYVPQTPGKRFRSYKVETPFTWRSEVTAVEQTEWMPGFCFFLPSTTIDKVGLFDERFDVWYGDSDFETRLKQHGAIVKIRGLFVYHYGRTSYSKLNKEKLEKRINKDRLYYLKKWKK